MFRILVHKLVKLINSLKSAADNLVITYDKNIDVAVKSYKDASDTVSMNLNDKKATC